MRKQILLKEKKAVLSMSVVVLLALVMVASLLDSPMTFEDSGLEEAIRENLRLPLTKTNLLTVTELDASGREIKSLDGIQHLRKLVSLNLEGNFVEDLSPLAELEKLTELNLRNNEITDLDAVNFASIIDLPLRKLSLRHNIVLTPEGEQIRLSDLSLLQHLAGLEELILRDNHIADISPLSGLTNLKVLDLRENNISTIEPLKNLTALKKLNLRENDLTDLTPLERLTGLVYLNIHSNENLVSIEPLTRLVNLETLIMRHVPIENHVIYLRDLKNLQHLNIRNCGIDDLHPIGHIMSLGALQDDPVKGLEATVDIRDNNLFIRDADPFEPIGMFWGNITHRFPLDLYPRLEPPSFSHTGGFYEEGLLLELTTDVPGAVIYYTLDGSEPSPENVNGSVYYYKNEYPLEPGDPFGQLIPRTYRTQPYSGPIALTGKNGVSDSIARINTTNAATAAPPNNIFHGTVVRAVTYKDGYPASPIVTNSYLIGNGINDRYHVPVISVVTAEPNLFDYETGIYVAGKAFDDWRTANPLEERIYWDTPGNYYHRGVEWEKEANLEIYAPEGELLLNQVAGIRIHGVTSRARPNKSLRFYARTDYGKSTFNVQLFQDKEINEFKRFLLRNAGNDVNLTYFRDALMQSLVKNLRMDYQAYQPAVLFINGVYWGIFNIRERIDRFYLHQQHGVEPDKIDLLELHAAVVEGDNRHYLEMLDYIKKNDVSKPDVYTHINTLMDIDNFINYNISQIYFDNRDWPNNNVYYWRLQTEHYNPGAPYGYDGRWRWIFYDTDVGFGIYDGEDAYMHNMFDFLLGEDSPKPDSSTFLLRSMLENPNFKFDFFNRFADHLNTVFRPDVVIMQIDGMQKNLAPLMQEHLVRWGCALSGPKSVERWEENIEVMRVFARGRPGALRGHVVDYFGLSGTASITLRTDYSKGTVLINTIDTGRFLQSTEDPGWQGIYFKDVPVTITAIPNPGYIFAGWEEVDDRNASLSIELKDDLTLTPIFSLP